MCVCVCVCVTVCVVRVIYYHSKINVVQATPCFVLDTGGLHVFVVLRLLQPRSIFNATYDDDQKKSHTDYIQLSMQSQFNKRAL